MSTEMSTTVQDRPSQQALVVGGNETAATAVAAQAKALVEARYTIAYRFPPTSAASSG